jgi:hypothetical protein
MIRSAGVTVNAIVALLGSVLTLAMGALMLFGMVFALQSAPVEPSKDFPLPAVYLKAFMMLMPLVYVLPAVWGICTGIGLLRLKNWARISIIVFAGLLAAFGLFGAFGALVVALVKLPSTPDVDPAAMTMVRIFMVLFAMVQLGLGAWWLFFFNRATVRSQFQRQPALFAGAGTQSVLPAPPPAPVLLAPPGPTNAASPSRPISVTIIAWYLLLGCALIPTNLALHTPAILFTSLLTGWTAAVYYLVLVAVQIYVGIGLLRLQPAARLVGMGYFLVSFLSSAVFNFAPGGQARVAKLIASQLAMFPWMKVLQDENPMKLDLTPIVRIGSVAGLAIVLVVFYFLFTGKGAFAGPNRQAAD